MIYEDTIFENSTIIMPERRLPEGYFYAYIHPENTKISYTKAEKKCIIWELEILGPRYNGVVIRKYSMLEGAGIAYTKGDLLALDHRVQSLYDCKVAMRMLKNAVINIYTERAGDFLNIQFIGKTKPDEMEMSPPEYYSLIHWK